MTENNNPFGICFNMLKIKYAKYDETISSLGVLNPNDKVNVFLNVETILNYLSTIRELDEKLNLHREFTTTMVSDLINVAAHYKEFFKNNGLDTKVFLYMTDLTSEEEAFHESQYNIDFRSYYLNKYQGNPRYGTLYDGLIETIIPRVQSICQFIPDVYFIHSKNIDGSLIPYIISEEYPDRKNFIISSDAYETQYTFMNNFVHHLFKRGFTNYSLSYDIKSHLKVITKSEEITPDELKVFSNQGFYTLLLAARGDRYRSICKINNIGMKTLTKIILQNINMSRVTYTTESIELISEMFDDKQKDEIIENYNSISLKNSISLITDGEKKLITTQIIDRSDINSLLKINKELFVENELHLESLLR